MSAKMVDHIVNQHHIDIDSEMVKRVKVSNLFPDRTYYGCIILFEVLPLASSRRYYTMNFKQYLSSDKI